MSKQLLIYTFICLFLLSGCIKLPEFNVKDLAKTDIDNISEVHLNQVVKLLKKLTEKLYKKNPRELQKVDGWTIEARIDQIFSCPIRKKYKELDFKEGTDAILLGFEPEFKGDRVFAMMYGLYTMIHTSYNNKCELFILDYLNEQSLYNSARNIEVFVWRLKSRHLDNGQLVILTNSFEDEVENLSYERIFGKLISLQDTMALIVSGRTGRMIKEVIQMAGMTFFPVNI